MSERVAIIGAGMAGLAAARALTGAGKQVVIYEQSPVAGGRVATQRIAECLIDYGAQDLKPTGTALGDVMLAELPTDDLLRIEAPVRLYTDDGQFWPPDPEFEAELKYAYRYGLATLPRLLAQQLPEEQTAIHYKTRIHRLEEEPDAVILRNETGQEVGRTAAVIVTCPSPQAADLLGESALRMRNTMETLDRVRALRNVEYTSCLSVMLVYAPPVPPPPAYALLAEDRSSTLLWLAFEQMKAPERAPGGEAALVAQFGPRFSDLCMVEPDELIIGRTLNELRPLFGEQYGRPLRAQVKRWNYSQPRGMALFTDVNPLESSSSVIVCGDALRPGGGRVQQAYASGLEAAQAVLNLLEKA